MTAKVMLTLTHQEMLLLFWMIPLTVEVSGSGTLSRFDETIIPAEAIRDVIERSDPARLALMALGAKLYAGIGKAHDAKSDLREEFPPTPAKGIGCGLAAVALPDDRRLVCSVCGEDVPGAHEGTAIHAADRPIYGDRPGQVTFHGRMGIAVRWSEYQQKRDALAAR